MVSYYVLRVRLMRMTIDEVPERYRDAVKEKLGIED